MRAKSEDLGSRKPEIEFRRTEKRACFMGMEKNLYLERGLESCRLIMEGMGIFSLTGFHACVLAEVHALVPCASCGLTDRQTSKSKLRLPFLVFFSSVSTFTILATILSISFSPPQVNPASSTLTHKPHHQHPTSPPDSHSSPSPHSSPHPSHPLSPSSPHHHHHLSPPSHPPPPA